MDDLMKPEEKLRRVRLRAKIFFEQLDKPETALAPAATSAAETAGNPISAEQLNLFLRSLNLHLRSAITEVRETSRDLAELTAEARQVERRLGQGN